MSGNQKAKRWWKSTTTSHRLRVAFGVEIWTKNDARDLPGTFGVNVMFWRYRWRFGREVRPAPSARTEEKE